MVLKVKIPAGSRALFADALASDAGTVANANGISTEHEIILPRGTRYRVIGRLEDTTYPKSWSREGKHTAVSVPTYEVEVIDTPLDHPLPATVAKVRPPRKVDTSLVGEGRQEFTKRSMPGPVRSGLVTDMERLLKTDGRWGGYFDRSSWGKLTDAELESLAEKYNVSRKSLTILLKDLML